MSQFGWIQLLEVSGDSDLANKNSHIVPYIVEGYDATTILLDPGKVIDLKAGSPTIGMSLPLKGSPYPGDDTAILDAYAVVTANVTTGGAKVTTVQALYSNDRRWRALTTPINRTTPGIIRDTFQREKLFFDIPFAKRGKIDQTGTNIDVPDWFVHTRRVPHVIYKRVITITLANFTTGMSELVAAQNDRLHWFDNSWWAFESGDSIPVEDDEGKYEIEYIWAKDPGTLGIGFSLTPGQLAAKTVFPGRDWKFDFDGLDIGSVYVRPPHHFLEAIFPDDNTQTPPVFEPFRTKVLDREGWKTLPGLGDA